MKEIAISVFNEIVRNFEIFSLKKKCFRCGLPSTLAGSGRRIGVAVGQATLDWPWLATFEQLIGLQRVQVDVLVARPRPRLVDVGHVHAKPFFHLDDGAAVLLHRFARVG